MTEQQQQQIPDDQAQLVEIAQVRIAAQRLRLAQKQEAGKLNRTEA